MPGIELLGEELGFACQSPQRGRKKEVIDLAQQNAHQVWQKLIKISK
ncbi:hypothetical protein [endosymbiont GvMRE of Glomus versiforme]|nr:hypothetical protein [endosymbiont GvMRE of Glomus versiforme]